jgi:uncharacterized membrane protein HdeD (DUF308 family)
MSANSAILGNVGASAQALCRRTWWAFVLGGAASVAFGVIAFVRPGLGLFLLATFFGAALLVDGAFNAIGAVQHREKDGWWVMLLMGILGVVVGFYALWHPPATILALVYLAAFQALVLGMFLVTLGYKVRKATSREWMLYVAGALSILFGIVVVMNPAVGSISIVYTIAVWAVIIGVLKVIFAFKVKNMPERIESKLAGLR